MDSQRVNSIWQIFYYKGCGTLALAVRGRTVTEGAHDATPVSHFRGRRVCTRPFTRAGRLALLFACAVWGWTISGSAVVATPLIHWVTWVSGGRAAVGTVWSAFVAVNHRRGFRRLCSCLANGRCFYFRSRLFNIRCRGFRLRCRRNCCHGLICGRRNTGSNTAVAMDADVCAVPEVFLHLSTAHTAVGLIAPPVVTCR